ncbi:MAG: hypothetical protein EZS28_001055 [Streblomastix strix]|uniref:Uncharacterized protein n=1 Tax=Streblomastix strix TaxID=222440 RepID=A0A5J4X8C6_9EUKA|nr:MAG: hypothetical protein EZS28_001055 [Streblomastix strix]
MQTQSSTPKIETLVGKLGREKFIELLQIQNQFKENNLILQMDTAGLLSNRKDILHKQMEICLQYNEMFSAGESRNALMKKAALSYGIVDSLVKCSNSHAPSKYADMFSIPLAYLAKHCKGNIQEQIIQANPFPAFVRLISFVRSDKTLVDNGISAISYLLYHENIMVNETHPQYEVLSACNGIIKIFELFKRNTSKQSRDCSALSLGYLYRSREIEDQRMRQMVITHLKSLISDPDLDIKEYAIAAINCVSRNPVNLAEILKGDELAQVKNVLLTELKGNERQKKMTQTNQENKCHFLIAMLHNRKDDNLHNLIIDVGIFHVLLYVFANRELNLITPLLSTTFDEIVNNVDEQILLKLLNTNPFKALIRLIVHPNELICRNAIVSICTFLELGSGSSNSDQHPYFDQFSSSNWISQIFKCFHRNSSEEQKNYSAICIGLLYKNREIVDTMMKQQIISHLKSLSSCELECNSKAKKALIYLALNVDNRREMKRDGFKIPDYEDETGDDGEEEDNKVD